MPEFKLNGKTYSGSTSYASAIDYTEADGSKTTVQDKISELDENISEQNKNFEWKLAKVCEGTEQFTDIKDSYKEYKLMAYNIGGWWCEITLPASFLIDEIQYVQAGANSGLMANFYVSKTSIRLSTLSYGGNDSTSFKMYVYVR